VANKLVNQLSNSYRNYDCKNSSCDLYDDCKIIKWLWFYDGTKLTLDENKNRIKAYCKMKKVINSGLYDGIIENQENIIKLKKLENKYA